MHRLMLLRHAKAEAPAAGQRDQERVLAARGREQAPLVGTYMAHHGLFPDRVLVSPAARTRQTWELAASALGQEPPAAYEPRLYEANPKALLQLLKETAGDPHSLLVVGHNPGLHELAKLLLAAGDIDARQRLIEKFPTSGLAVIDFPIKAWSALHPHSGRLERFVTPRALEAASD